MKSKYFLVLIFIQITFRILYYMGFFFGLKSRWLFSTCITLVMANSEQFVVPGFFKIWTDGLVRIKVGASVVVHQPLVFNLKLQHFFLHRIWSLPNTLEKFQIYSREFGHNLLSSALSLFFLNQGFVEIKMIVMV